MKWWGFALLALASVMLGEQVGHWRGQAEAAAGQQEAADTIQKLQTNNADLRLAIASQNTAVAVADARAKGAQDAAQQAQAYAATLAQMSESRLKKIDQALKDAKTVGEVLSRYWELRQ